LALWIALEWSACRNSPASASKDKPECWYAHYAAVAVGTLAERSCNPAGTDRCKWGCGFYPGNHPREHRNGTATNFRAARSAFEAAWRDFLPSRTEADFQEWRRQAAWTAENTAASIAASGCRRTGNHRRGLPVVDPGWKRSFDEPIPLPRGGQLVTLEDAGRYVMALPEAEQRLDAWQAATEALMVVATLGGPTMFARIGMMMALNPKVAATFDSSRKETHWGKRKLKRDQ
jgi:hypothetical protein